MAALYFLSFVMVWMETREMERYLQIRLHHYCHFFAAQRQYLNVERSVMSQTTSIYVHFFVFNDFAITGITASS